MDMIHDLLEDDFDFLDAEDSEIQVATHAEARVLIDQGIDPGRIALPIQVVKATLAKQRCKDLPKLRIRAGEVITKAMLQVALGIETTVQKLARWAESTKAQHIAGSECPHCKGSGRYRLHTDATSNGKCYRCDGKGVINAKDLAFLARRTKGNEPICWATTAA
jgi:hypothetical protein